MKQAFKASAVETMTSVLIGLLVSWLITFYALPLWGLEPSPAQSLSITAVYTAASFARQLFVRRLFA
ncbi:hypothetical protein GWO43_30270 [candidate division KSB1 bacterium]|nr:hypothetical protein [candidate division KSB1 bacterium]NIT75068.1 hypothetical protein [candidate division KSB1 bacterium]NIX74748.1 hypothetical protein [candidate division KSB1 bacterium]